MAINHSQKSLGFQGGRKWKLKIIKFTCHVKYSGKSAIFTVPQNALWIVSEKHY